MASKRGLSATADAVDVAYLLDAFQHMNSCILSVSFELTVRSGRPDLLMSAQAFTVDAVTAERVPLVSWKSSLRQSNWATLEAAFICCLYRVDGLLAAREMSVPQPK